MGDFENGDIIAIHDFDGYFMGYGYINTQLQDHDPSAGAQEGYGDR